MHQTQIAEGARALRDFFSAMDAEDIKSSAIDISRQFGLPCAGVADWGEVEYDYNRLFVGPAAVPAPPYASAYQDEPTLMGQPALEARYAYRRLGLAVPDQGATPDDHLAYELDAVLAFGSAAQSEGGEGMAELSHWFISEHMAGWVPRFTAAIGAQEGVSAPVRMAARALERWLDLARGETREGQDRTQPSTKD